MVRRAADPTHARAGQRLREGVWGPVSTRVRGSRNLRGPAIAAYRATARVVLRGSGPRVLANSVPKAGTHLLTQVLGGVPGLWYSGEHLNDADFRAVPAAGGWSGESDFDGARLRSRLTRVGTGQFVTAHLGAGPVVGPVLAGLGYRHLLMIRDPRDIAVSMAFYLAKNERLELHRAFAEDRSADERLTAAICGLPATGGAPALPSIGQRLAQFTPWLQRDDVCVVRFEDLVGARGGGDDDRQRESIRAVLAHCGREADDAAVARLAGRAFDDSSATFRSGMIGGWREHFTPEHRAAFDTVAGTLMPVLGYPGH